MSPDASKRGMNAAPSSMAFLSEGWAGKKLIVCCLSASQGHEANLFLRIHLHFAGKRGGDGHRTLLADPTHGHAHMLGLDHDGNATRLQNTLDAVSDLRGDAFLR